MNSTIRYVSLAAAAMLFGGAVASVRADDSAASVAAGGIQLRREANISMEKEVLTISQSKVTVEYEFLNETDNDITTEVAFPVPPYDAEYTGPGGHGSFEDFRLWVEGKELKYHVEVRAELNGKDYTDLLKGLGIDIASFGGWDDENGQPVGPVTRLPDEELRRLSILGLISSEDGYRNKMPLWDVVKKYYWTQTFPAHQILRVRHEYTPDIGYTLIDPADLNPVQRKKQLSGLRPGVPVPPDLEDTVTLDQYIENSCIDSPMQEELAQRAAGKPGANDGTIIMLWVDFILTTANSWKTPIKDFTLDVERLPAPRPAPGQVPPVASFCWNGPITEPIPGRLEAHATNFVPTKELHVAFFAVHQNP
jgi:hypothetical protein